MKKVLASNDDIEKVTTFNDLLYSYSHKKFYEVISIPEVSTVIMMLFEVSQVRRFVQNHPTLSANSEEYEDHIQRMLRQIEFSQSELS
mmetsp:Transcript_12008/g.13651  ORF Transcript_12008/g.13651 Transcript_12008/m.13651 type:complete len:88 (+) Transcript_12008:293-556(+)